MATFMIGLAILVCGGFLYGSLCERVFGPDNRETPAYAKQDGVDYVPMPTWKNALINLLNIAGTGPILGPIQGILFGPIALLTIPIGNVIGGAMHDYFAGMICTRDGGIQMPDMVKKYTNKGVFWVYDIFVCVLLLLVGAVFIYTPGDIAATQVFGFSGGATDPTTWIIYGAIFVYYFIATVFPIDKIIGRVYPIFGAVLVFSAIGVFIAMIVFRYPLVNIWDSWNTGAFAYGDYFFGVGDMKSFGHFMPIFFVTVACGILSGFHSTQTALIARTMKSEHEGKTTFYNMMIVEGFIAMVWAAGTMALIQMGAAKGGLTMQFDNGALKYFQQAADGSMKAISATSVVGVLCRKALGPVGGAIALIGVIVLPVTSGDTALRALRLTIADTFHIKQDNNARRLALATPIFVLVFGILIWSKFDANGFNQLWRYFAWSNQAMALFALAAAAIYLLIEKKGAYVWMPLIPGIFYTIVCGSYILNAKIGFRLPWNAAYIGSVLLAVLYAVAIFVRGKRPANTL